MRYWHKGWLVTAPDVALKWARPESGYYGKGMFHIEKDDPYIYPAQARCGAQIKSYWNRFHGRVKHWSMICQRCLATWHSEDEHACRKWSCNHVRKAP